MAAPTSRLRFLLVAALVVAAAAGGVAWLLLDGRPGDACATAADCDSGRCREGVCTVPCRRDEDCPDAMYCEVRREDAFRTEQAREASAAERECLPMAGRTFSP